MEKSLGKAIKTFTSRMQARLLLVFCVVTLLMVSLMGRLIYIIYVDGDRYAKQVLSRQSYVSALLPYKRGEIMDRNGTVLARSELQYRLILDPRLLLQNPEYIPTTMAALKDDFNIDNQTVQTILDEKPDSQYVITLRNLKYETVEAFKAKMKEDKKIVGVWFEEEYVRAYPYNTIACDILGFTSADNTGFFGIEEYYNDELNGTNGREYRYYDADLNIERIVKKAVNGNSVISTIDANVQRILQQQIADFNNEIGSLNIGILVMDPNNGEIIGAASNQEYDLNDPRNLESFYSAQDLAAMTNEEKINALNTLWKNDVISHGFEPGSTFKPVTVAAALEENIVNEESTFYCDGGEQVGDYYIHCSKRTGHGELTLGEALMYSCNDALMQIAREEGKDIFFRYQNSFGFGQKTGVDLPGEEGGLVVAQEAISPTDLATSSFGQTFTVTMVQMAAAFSSLVNGGYYYQPHVVKEIVNDSGATVKKFDKLLVRQTASKQTSDFIQQYLYQTVETGTAQGAKVEGYSIGGKTGTAEKQPRDADTYIVSFLGCAPAVNPEVVIYVMIDEPQNVERQADSSIATRFASKILKQILPVLGIYPEGEIDYLLPTQAPDDTANTEGTAGNQTGDTQSQDTQGQNPEDTQTNGDTSGTQDTQGAQGDITSGDTQEAGGEPETAGGDTGGGDNQDPSGTQTGEGNSGEGGQDTEGDTPGDDQEQNSNTSGGEDEFNPDVLD
jgi:stage V sporulation protein D (sporulation-specific penicillin-binding protein)